jgi:hypothetical protein
MATALKGPSVKKGPNYVAKLEKAIRQKYGEDTIQNPKANWTDEKEKKYLEELKETFKKELKRKDAKEKVETNGFLVPKQLLIKDSNRVCPVCRVYSFVMKDDVYMNKYECCFKCYVQWVENREERWKSGWRPNDEVIEE